MKLTVVASIISALAVSSAIALADEKPPQNIKPLSEIVTSLEQQGFKQITEIEFEKGKWEVEVYQDNQKRELEVDPSSGKILSNKPD
ncbi:MAG: PepSY domain-containing protein [Candidatus Nitrosoglobus sp.]|jgi:uncharacterized membrane protein YkoI